ncbi:DUF2523 family protein [Dyella terrae]|uniref:DUF2523 family protein n=1 Tax=Dyella terrae TaxID=522259 RepID=UPI001EFD9FA0|nr:DUF2523 family protein [Dyella terrae]ULU23792.1 DUF2523 protein [Dyella terrae]
MPALVAWIGEMLLSVVGQLAITALVSVGIGFAANAGVSAIIDSSSIRSMMGAAGPLLGWVAILRIDQCITIVLSAWAGRKITDAAKVRLTANTGKTK